METFFQLVEDAIDLNGEVRKALSSYEDAIEIVAYNMDHATIHLAVGRNVGKTSYITQHAKKDDLIIVHNKFNKFVMEKKINRSSLPIHVLTPELLRNFFMRTNRYHKTIYIDEPRLVGIMMDREGISRREFYSLTAKDKKQTYILLGI